MTLQTFIDADLWDEARVITTHTQLSEGIKAPFLDNGPVEEVLLGEDSLSIYYSNSSQRL